MKCQRCQKDLPLESMFIVHAKGVTAFLCCDCKTAAYRSMIASKEYREFRRWESIQRGLEKLFAKDQSTTINDLKDAVNDLADAELALHDLVAKLVRPMEGQS